VRILQHGELTRNNGQESAAPLRFPPEDAGKSLADIVRRDLDAALQLLTDRAQYITGASGAAIALKRNGMNDMLCRASTGENAPELGALLSTEYGLSGESVRTRQALRCDDAEQDERVNREVCRQLGIASVVVMPVVHDDEVLGVFELFSGKANAFGERDLSAVQRLTEMVQTAVRLAHAAETLPETLKAAPVSGEGGQSGTAGGFAVSFEEDIHDEPALEDEQILEIETVEALGPPVTGPMSEPPESAHAAVAKTVVETGPVIAPVIEAAASEADSAAPPIAGHVTSPVPAERAGPAAQAIPLTESAGAQIQKEAASVAPAKLELAPKIAGIEPPKKKLFWSAALDLAAETEKREDQSHVPPVLRGLRKCEACGFPVSAGRALCVECEERKWRGQLRKAPSTGNAKAVGAIAAKQSDRAAAAPAAAVMAVPGEGNAPARILPANGGARENPELSSAAPLSSPEKASSDQAAQLPTPELILSAAVMPRQSWLSSHKYIVVGLLVAAALVAIFLSR
jgi:hypothetical protein